MAIKEGRPSYVPIKQIPPKYPRRLMEKGIDGCVMLSFDITKGGKTKNVEVVWSTHSGFERPARKAGIKYIFSPPFIEGVLSEIEGARTLLVFKIDSKDNTSSVFLLDAPEISPYKPGRGLLEKIFLLTLIFYIPALSIEAFKNRNELFI